MKLRSGKRKYANEKATIALERVTAAAARPLIQKLLKNQWATGATFKRYCVAGTGRSGPLKFHAQCAGISLLSNVSPFGLNDALTSHRNGYRNRTDSPASSTMNRPCVSQFVFGVHRRRVRAACGSPLAVPAVIGSGWF